MKLLLTLCLAVLLIPSAAFAQQDVPMSAKEKRSLDTFCSNFAETNLASFKKGDLTDQEMLRFAQIHCVLNASKKFQTVKGGRAIVIPAADVDRITEKYFGLKMQKQSAKDYTVDLGSGEAYVFAQVDKMTDLGDGTFKADGTIYYTGSGETPDPHGTPASWKKADIDVRVSAVFTGIIKKETAGKERYILLSYNVVDKQ